VAFRQAHQSHVVFYAQVQIHDEVHQITGSFKATPLSAVCLKRKSQLD
jgi:hypothetical protein